MISEDEVRRAWIDFLPVERYTERVIERTLAFHALPPPLQAAEAVAWPNVIESGSGLTLAEFFRHERDTGRLVAVDRVPRH